jgi:hypothetical protein
MLPARKDRAERHNYLCTTGARIYA